MKLERRKEATTDRDQDLRDADAKRRPRHQVSEPPRAQADDELRMDASSRDARDNDDPFRGKSDGEILARYQF